jgi:hypothetical protein
VISKRQTLAVRRSFLLLCLVLIAAGIALESVITFGGSTAKDAAPS